MRVRHVVKDAVTGEQREEWIDLPCMTEAEAQAADLIRRGDEARAERNRRLAACDWTVLPDAPLDATKRAQWAVYRTALRDVPDQPGFPDLIDWPASVIAQRAMLPESQ